MNDDGHDLIEELNFEAAVLFREGNQYAGRLMARSADKIKGLQALAKAMMMAIDTCGEQPIMAWRGAIVEAVQRDRPPANTGGE